MDRKQKERILHALAEEADRLHGLGRLDDERGFREAWEVIEEVIPVSKVSHVTVSLNVELAVPPGAVPDASDVATTLWHIVPEPLRSTEAVGFTSDYAIINIEGIEAHLHDPHDAAVWVDSSDRVVLVERQEDE